MNVRAMVSGPVLTLVLVGAPDRVRHANVAQGACSLVTQQEATKALGKPVPTGIEQVMNAPVMGRQVKMELCLYGSEVTVARYALGSVAQTYFAQYRQSLAGKSDYQDVKGLGDEAFAAKGQLTVRKGEAQLIIDVGQARGGGAKELEAEKSLAVLALGRL